MWITRYYIPTTYYSRKEKSLELAWSWERLVGMTASLQPQHDWLPVHVFVRFAGREGFRDNLINRIEGDDMMFDPFFFLFSFLGRSAPTDSIRFSICLS